MVSEIMNFFHLSQSRLYYVRQQLVIQIKCTYKQTHTYPNYIVAKILINNKNKIKSNHKFHNNIIN